MRFSILIAMAGLATLAACGDPAANKSRAVTGEAAQVSSPQAASGQKYLINPQNSKIEFTASKVTRSHQGSFEKFSGEVDYTGVPETSRVTITIDADSITTDTPDLTKHLKTSDFFDVAKFPQATFVSTAIKPGGDNGASHTITGNVTMHGVTKSIAFPATISVAPDAVTVDSTFSINRKDFGLNYPGLRDDLIRDNVVLTLKVRATKT